MTQVSRAKRLEAPGTSIARRDDIVRSNARALAASNGGDGFASHLEQLDGLIAAGIALAIIAVVNGLGTALNDKFSSLNTTLK